MLHKLWNFIQTELGRMLFGFLLTSVVGGSLVAYYQQSNWERQKELEYALQQRQWMRDKQFEVERQRLQWEKDRRFEMLRRRLDKAETALDEITELMRTRTYAMRGVFDSIIANDSAAVSARWRPYMDTVQQWNTKLSGNRSKLCRFVSMQAANELQNYETSTPDRLITPKSIHGRFFMAHRRLDAMSRCLQTGGPVTAEERRAFAKTLDELDDTIDSFVDRTTNGLLGNQADLTPSQQTRS
jgi:hypothetical protein